MDEHRMQLRKVHCKVCKQALEANGFQVQRAKDASQARQIVNTMIQDGDLVCDGGSMTLQESGILSMLEARDINYRSHNDPTLTREESDAEARKAFYADVFLASANAVTMQGEILNIDGHGNRVSAMIFGPKTVILIVGVNKIVKDETAGIERIQQIAAPANCLRLHKETPCSHLGSCQNCHSKDRICSSYVKLNYDKESRIHVILVEEDLGY